MRRSSGWLCEWERPSADCSEHPVQSVLRPRGSCCLCLDFAHGTWEGATAGLTL